MPASTPAALNPIGAVTPPSTGRTWMSLVIAALDMERLLCSRAVVHGVQIRDHGVLPTLTEQGARSAVGGNLLRQPRMRHDREPHMCEIRRLMREHAQVVIAISSRACAQLV